MDTEPALPLAVSYSVSVPDISSPNHVLVRVRAVGLNPTDYKMLKGFNTPGLGAGCDFCGTVELAGAHAAMPAGTRICGAVFPYHAGNAANGAFSQWLVADSRLLLKVPDSWTDEQAAGLGAVGWSTASLCLSDPQALALQGLPSKPAEKHTPVVVYGGATATGLMAIQLLKRSGYAPIAVCSPASSPLVIDCGAVATVAYTSPDCVETVKSIAAGAPIRQALDCITQAESASVCFGAIARTGGRYACLEEFHDSWRTRRAVKVKVVMGFEIEGVTVDLEHQVYTRKARPELLDLGVVWAREMQGLLDAGAIKTQPIREVQGGLEGVIKGLSALQRGEARGHKLVARVFE
ncbi:hypothetical protein CDD81_710 [Ophiocordyceps australis]|uniref:Enoyl reductase (ER) domain-containing protein n=1 Tax=Ophiocordyceps australis TaxID=1399860 RepID=A0A2C5XXK2_9HYPO|nr:hypothetical protein CDD81_710 [Ophiocordyceps australis]